MKCEKKKSPKFDESMLNKKDDIKVFHPKCIIFGAP